MAFEYELPAGASVEHFIDWLAEKADIRLISKRYSLKTYYDSFDWRLWRSDLLCEFTRSKDDSVLTLKKSHSGRIVASQQVVEIPTFPGQLKPGRLQSTLQSLLDMRALLAVATLEYEALRLNLYNEDEKIVLRMLVENYEYCPSRLILQPVKGYAQETRNLTELLDRYPDLKRCDKTVLQVALSLQGRKPGDYSGKINLDIDPNANADQALKAIFIRLLAAMKINESGAIADTDSEFLHDFRVSVRRTRSGLSQLKGILPDDVTEHYIDFFAWISQATSTTRDLDVYLHGFNHYKENLPPDMRDQLDPLRHFLLQKKQEARLDMIEKLQSFRYRTTLLAWEGFLKRQAQSSSSCLTIKELADRRILKVYRRLLRQGRAITDESAAEELHTLRKTCKKLRYLMEFFQRFYPDRTFKQGLKALKELQGVLGDFQDFHVQEYAIKQYGEQMTATGMVPANTLLAMGILIQRLDERKRKARKLFSISFEHFDRKKNHSLFRSLFSQED